MRFRQLFWNQLLNSVLALTLVAALALETGNEQRPAVGGFENVELAENATPEERALVEWAAGRFARAGLTLPHLEVRFDPTREQCNYAEGLYRERPTGERVVIICTRDSDTFAARLARRRTLLHEFGHAWDSANLSPEDRDELSQILGAGAWNDHDELWEARGVERFAETFVFALLDQPLRQVKVDLECPDLIRAFRIATEADPLGPGLPPCAIRPSS